MRISKLINFAHLLTLNFLLIITMPGNSQNPHYNDHLGKQFHSERRDALRLIMPDNSVAVFFSNAIRNRSNDVDYIYHQDPDFFYLTGHKEPHSVLFVFKDPVEVDGDMVNELIFVRGRDALKELYDGGRLGTEGAIEQLGFESAYTSKLFKDFNLDFSVFDKVMFYDFQNDYRDHAEEGDLYELISAFKQKVGITSDTDLAIEPKKSNIDMKTLNYLMNRLRGIKTEEELSLLRKAIDISTLAQAEVMKAMKPGMSETEVQGLHEFIFKKYRAEYEGYPSIVGAGHNGCVLHYIENYKPSIADGEMILMDLGAEYHGYTADVTRTIPVNGKFTEEQKIIYDLVYEAQEAAMKVCKEGASFADLYMATAKVINEGLVELGLYESADPEAIVNPETGRNRYYPHGCCHHIGLDVHDKGLYDKLEENMVITIEPGIYIPHESPADQKWWDIAVRIEDDFLINKKKCELLSDKAPRKSKDIEVLMAEPSAFDAVVLPELEEN